MAVVGMVERRSEIEKFERRARANRKRMRK